MARVFLLLTAITLWACGGEYEVRVQVVPPSLLDDAEAIEIGIVPSCDQPAGGAILGEPIIRFAPGETPPALGSSETGARGLFARLIGADCQVVGAGCAPVNLSGGGSDILRVIVREASAEACDTGESCSAGACIARDGGGEDSGMRDAMSDASDAFIADAAMDASIDVPGLDANVDVGPAVVDTTCWTEPDGCDWGEPGYSLVESSLLGLEVIPTTAVNWAFSPDGCALTFGVGGDLFITRRTQAGGTFSAPEELTSLNTAEREDKVVFTPGQLEAFVTRTVGDDAFVHRARRDTPAGPFGPMVAVAPLNRVGSDAFDISLSGDGLRLYMARPRNALVEFQDILIARRVSLSEEFGETVLVDELSAPGVGEAEPSPSADGRLMLVATRRNADTSIRLYHSMREGIDRPWGDLRVLPGAFFAAGGEREGAVSPDACEIIVRRADGQHRVTLSRP